MKKLILFTICIAGSFYLGYLFKSYQTKETKETFIEPKNITEKGNKQPEKNNTLQKVTGISGIFFKCKDPEKLKEWYKTHLGLPTDEYGALFEWYEGNDTTKKSVMQWSAFSEKTTYFSPSTKDFMINYRVQNLEELAKALKKENVMILDSIETYDYGKFLHIMDPEQNKIELFEPIYQNKK